MKDLFEKLIGLIPTYLDDLFSLLSGPKSFIAERIADNEPVMEKALVFLAVSFFISWILKISLIRGDPFLELGSDAIFVLIYVSAYGGALYSAWRIIGGRSEFKKVLTINFYYSGILKLMMSFVFLGMMGAIRISDPALYKDIFDSAYSGGIATFLINNKQQLLQNTGYRLSIMVQFVGFSAMLAWIFIGWGAYRELNQLSRLQSFAAGLLFILFCLPVTALMFLIANSLVK